MSIAYVFVQLLPELNAAQAAFDSSHHPALNYFGRHVYLLALLGVLVFYGLEYLTQHSRNFNGSNEGENSSNRQTFWVQITAFSVYNALIGYLLEHTEEQLIGCILFSIAMGLHFVVNDHSLREHFKDDYDRIGRWILAAAIIAGWVAGKVSPLNELLIWSLLAFLAGGITLNAIKDEIPVHRETCYWSFFSGAAAYALILLMSAAFLGGSHH